MEPLNKHSFEEEWRRAMADASEQPPASVWDKIEQALDEKPERKGIFWLWLNNNRLRIAAGIALFLSFGLLFYKTSILSDNQSELTTSSNKKTIPLIPNKNESTSSDKQNLTANKKTEETNFSSIKTEKSTLNNSSQSTANNIVALKKEINFNSNNDFDLAIKKTNTETFIKEANNQIFEENKETESPEKLIVNVSTLASKSKIFLFPNRLERKLILDYEVAEVAAIKSKREFWLGLQSGGGSFNPNFSVASINSFAAKSFDSPYSPPQLDGMANMSFIPSDLPKIDYATPNNITTPSEGFRNGLTFGMKISKNWSLESGLAYVRGNSYIKSNTYTIDKNSGVKNTYFAGYLANNTSNETAKSNQSQAITTVADEAIFLNRYEFISIPIQTGFTFLAKRKLNFSILAGASADIFIGNLIGGNNNLNVSSFNISQKEKVYKPLNISGLGTFRVNYHLQKNWLAYFGGQYQQGLGSLLLNNGAIDLNLKQTGIQTGINYKF